MCVFLIPDLSIEKASGVAFVIVSLLWFHFIFDRVAVVVVVVVVAGRVVSVRLFWESRSSLVST